MSMKHFYETLELDGMSIDEAIIALQAWKNENPTAVGDYLSVGCYREDNCYIEVYAQRPMSETEIEAQKTQEAEYAIYQEQADRATYERLKAKFEGN